MRRAPSGVFVLVFLLGPQGLAQAQVTPDQSVAEQELTDLLEIRAVNGDIDGLIQRESGTFQGQTFLDFDGDGVRGASEPLVFQRQNAGRARIQGVKLEARLRPAEHWTVSGAVVRTVGTEEISGDPLRRIPPTHGRAVVGWSSGGRLRADGYSVFATRQTRLAPGDLTDTRIPVGGTPDFLTLNARGGLRINRALEITPGVENMTNRTYRLHGSGIDAAGTNAIVGIEWTY